MVRAKHKTTKQFKDFGTKKYQKIANLCRFQQNSARFSKILKDSDKSKESERFLKILRESERFR